MYFKVKKLHDSAIIPTTREGDAGYDLYALEDVFIPKHSTKKIRTGIALELPTGTFAKIEDRSSMAAKSLRTGAGICDESYTGEIIVVIHYLGTDESFNMGYSIKRGDKIAQFVIHESIKPNMVITQEDLKTTVRGTAGFGSSGI